MGRVSKIQRKKYDCAVGLGSCCQTAHHLYRLGYRGPAYPFDWLVLEWPSLYSILENKFSGFLDKDTLELRQGRCVYDKRYGTRLLHDFKYKKDFVWLEDYQYHYDKYWRRIERFLELTKSGKKVLLVRRECSREQAVSLRNMMMRVYPGFNFRLLVVDDTDEVRTHWGELWVDNYYVAQKQPYEWKGLDSEWDRVLMDYDIPKV